MEVANRGGDWVEDADGDGVVHSQLGQRFELLFLSLKDRDATT